jgi:putative endonuclease
VADGDGLENRCLLTGTVGSNPTPSAIASSASQTAWFFYIVRCNDNSLYSGMTNNLEKRIKKHNDGTGAKYTFSHRPVILVHSERFSTYSEATKRENEVKSWPKNKKEALILSEVVQQKGRL